MQQLRPDLPLPPPPPRSHLLTESESKSESAWEKYGTWQNYAGGGVLLISFCCCIPGLFIYDSAVVSAVDGSRRHYSAWGLVDLLWNAEHNELKGEVDPTITKVPAALVMFFCIMMPFIKLFATIVGLYLQSDTILWSVARVAKFQHVDGQIIMLLNSYLQLPPIIVTELKPGFYLFLSYCILSSLSTQILLSQFVKAESIAKHQSLRVIWFPIALCIVTSVIIFFFYAPVMTVSPVDPQGIQLARIRKTMIRVLLDSNWFCASWLVTTVVILPCITYAVIPAIIELGPPQLVARLGGEAHLQLLMEYLHDWTLGDVLFLAYLIMWLIVLASKWTNPEVFRLGGYFMILYGISSGFMIYLFQLNACVQGADANSKHSTDTIADCSDSEAEDDVSSRHLIGRNQRASAASGVCLRCAFYVIVPGLYCGAAAGLLRWLELSSKPAMDMSSLDDVNRALERSLQKDDGALHIVCWKTLGSDHLGSLGSCSKKGQVDGPPDNLPCMDVPQYHVDDVSLPLGLKISGFTAQKGGPIFATDVDEGNFKITHLEVLFLTGLQSMQVSSVKIVDQGLQPGNAKRAMQLEIKIGIKSDPANKESLSLPVTVKLAERTLIPCCNPDLVTVRLGLTCHRKYPYFSLVTGEDAVSIDIDPENAMTGSGTSSSEHLLFEVASKAGFTQGDIERKVADLVAQHVQTSLDSSSIPSLHVLYPYSQVNITSVLSFLIRSNLPISNSDWEFCGSID
eukprot:TRINITY_DN88916_c0_g1_i1.p1 TRINITY_DN88916_c0_g1~~TRINITY_DN88916_c0_g1_i1.p1  ORF type:complete len:739 (-),score=98.19 TRINITY_DN88916_c0_g1_i1:52-2268(-)